MLRILKKWWKLCKLCGVLLSSDKKQLIPMRLFVPTASRYGTTQLQDNICMCPECVQDAFRMHTRHVHASANLAIKLQQDLINCYESKQLPCDNYSNNMKFWQLMLKWFVENRKMVANVECAIKKSNWAYVYGLTKSHTYSSTSNMQSDTKQNTMPVSCASILHHSKSEGEGVNRAVSYSTVATLLRLSFIMLKNLLHT